LIVSKSNFEQIIERLSKTGKYGLDTETTGLRRSDRLFSIIFADEEDSYYFSFNDEPDHLGVPVPEQHRLPRAWIERIQQILDNPESTFYIHNAKFDMGMLAKEGLVVVGTVHCTEAMERVRKNNLGEGQYNLDACVQRLGDAKDDQVKAYIKKHKLGHKVEIPGKGKPADVLYFNKVPFSFMTEYAGKDARLHLKLGQYQEREFARIDAEAPGHAPKVLTLVENEKQLTKAVHRMEERGIRINRSYTQEALSYTQQAAASAMQSFEELTGYPYEESSATFQAVFKKFGVELPKTATGRPSTNKQVLDALNHPVADKIREIRGLQKLASTYYSSFLYFADENDIIHPNFRQGGTETSRFSCSDPNVQNPPKEDEEEDRLKPYIVRRCLIPRPGEITVAIDYKAQEFRMMIDYAGEHALIEAIMSGTDPHQATADLVGCTRKQAKTINFGLLYGMGKDKLARALGLSVQEAQELKWLYFSKLPKVKQFIRGVQDRATARGYVWNWNGFRCNLADPKNSYIIPNHLIQGGAGQVLRIAIVEIDAYCRAKRLRSGIEAQIHDELVFGVHPNEIEEVLAIQRIMESIYRPLNGMRLDCDVSHSLKSFAKWDLEKGLPASA
jgi:DNA polymerase I-like protein with 3'-5' exonuclease and polymerase domains